MQNTEPSIKPLAAPESRRNWLEVAEYLSIFGSAVGTLVAAVSQQFVLAAAPLTVAVSLNLINRTRLAQQQRQLTIVQPTNPESITSSFDELFPFSPTPELLGSVTDVDQEIAQIKTSLTQLQENTLSAIQELREQVSLEKNETSSNENTDLITIQQTVSQLQSKMKILEKNASQEEDWAYINVQFLLIQEAISELRNAVDQIQESRGRIDLNSETQSSKAPESDLNSMQLYELNQRIEQLEQKNREVVKPYLQQLVAEVKKLKKNSQIRI